MSRIRFEKNIRHMGYCFVSGKRYYVITEETILQENDLYYSTSGKWEKCPCPGIKFNPKAPALWMRPESEDPTYGNPKTSEFDRGYQEGLNGQGYRPSSIDYANGYESGELAAIRLGFKEEAGIPKHSSGAAL